MRLTRIYTGDDGRSHFEDVTLPDHDIRAGVAETEWVDALRASIRVTLGSLQQPRHVAPRRIVAAILSGALEVECEPGSTRRFEAGALVLIEDVSGAGHITRVAQRPCTFVQIELPNREPPSGELLKPFVRG